ncbi:MULTISPECIES: helix-turn-helix domain-containing protein [Bradyrhizobium]|uniref:helix-turn-helix domain-containing protein n=1 Tax=Bradyrhizobium TaxID=374 RepID=UPI00201225AC|nr:MULTISPECIES: helix-turn-helix domain-containing protein [Bradyrhizobium]
MNRQFPTAYKLKAIKRVERGEGVLPVARELGISRKILHDWIKAWKAHGPEGLNRKRGPKPGPRKLKPLATYEDKRSALTRANARIAELERLVGRQQTRFFCEDPRRWPAHNALAPGPIKTGFAMTELSRLRRQGVDSARRCHGRGSVRPTLR